MGHCQRFAIIVLRPTLHSSATGIVVVIVSAVDLNISKNCAFFCPTTVICHALPLLLIFVP